MKLKPVALLLLQASLAAAGACHAAVREAADVKLNPVALLLLQASLAEAGTGLAAMQRAGEQRAARVGALEAQVLQLEHDNAALAQQAQDATRQARAQASRQDWQPCQVSTHSSLVPVCSGMQDTTWQAWGAAEG